MYYKFWFRKRNTRPTAIIEYESLWKATELISYPNWLTVIIKAETRFEALLKLSFVEIKW